MKRILLISTMLFAMASAHTLTPVINCDTDSVTFKLTNGKKGNATVTIVDSHNIPIVGVNAYTAIIFVPSSGTLTFKVPRRTNVVSVKLVSIDNYINYACSQSCNVLAIKFSSYYLTKEGGGLVTLHFTIEDMSNVTKFTIERTPDFGKTYTTIDIFLPVDVKINVPYKKTFKQ